MEKEFLSIAVPLRRIAYGIAEDGKQEQFYGYNNQEWQHHFERRPEYFEAGLNASALIKSPSLWAARIDALERILRRRFLQLQGAKIIFFARPTLTPTSALSDMYQS